MVNRDYVNVSEKLGRPVVKRSWFMLVTQCVTLCALVFGCVWLMMALGELLK